MNHPNPVNLERILQNAEDNGEQECCQECDPKVNRPKLIRIATCRERVYDESEVFRMAVRETATWNFHVELCPLRPLWTLTTFGPYVGRLCAPFRSAIFALRWK